MQKNGTIFMLILVLLKGGQAFDYLIRNESSFFAPFSFNQRPDLLS